MTFGRFSVVYAVLLLILGLTRSFLGTRITLSDSSHDAARITLAAISGILMLSPLLVGAVLLTGTLLAGGIDLTVVAVALAAPIICVQDLVRYGSLSSDRPLVALISDLIWLVLIGGVLFLPDRLAGWAPVAWLAAATISMIVAIVAFGVRPAWKQGVELLRSWNPVSAAIAWGTLLALGTNLAVVSAAGAVLGLTAAGALRGASTLLGPINVLFAFVTISVTARLARADRNSDARRGMTVSTGLVLAAVFWGLLLVALPATWGSYLLGETWSASRTLLPITLLEYVFLAIASGGALVLRVRQKAKAIAVQKTVVAAVSMIAVIIVFIAGGGVRELAIGLAVAAFSSALLTWSGAVRADGRSQPE